jgi:hypothetical protein
MYFYSEVSGMSISPIKEHMKKIAVLYYFLVFHSALVAQVPFNWRTDEVHPGQDLGLYQDQSRFTEGEKSCRMVLESPETPYLLSDEYSVVPGTAYHFSIDIFDYDTTGQLKVYADFHDALGNDIWGNDPKFSADSSEWQTITWDGTVPESAVSGYVLIKFYCEPDLYTFIDSSIIWIDNVKFEIPERSNLVINGGFENWTSSVSGPDGEEVLFTIYPNPVGDFLYINNLTGSGTIMINDITGKSLMNFHPMHGVVVRADVSYLAKGIYLVVFQNTRGRIQSRKLLKY